MAPRTTSRTRTRSSEPAAIETLKGMVDVLIKENRSLKRQIAKLEASGATVARRGRTANPIATGLAGLQRKIQRALDTTAASGTRRGRASTRRGSSTGATRTRKPVSPETAARRLEALAKARAARAAKIAARSGQS